MSEIFCFLLQIIISQKPVAHSDTYIEKDSSINDEIDKLRHSATAAVL